MQGRVRFPGLYLRFIIILGFLAIEGSGGANLLAAQDRAQKLSFDVLSMEQGLSALPVTEILQDRSGFLWVATIAGLNRYDGYEFRVFRHASGDTNSLANNYIHTNALAEDAAGYLWIGTREGLSRLDPATERFKNYYHDPADTTSLSYDNVNHVLITRFGVLWVGTNRGLDRYDPVSDGFIHHRHDPEGIDSIDADTVSSLAEDAAGRIWIGTVRGLNRLDTNSREVERFPLPDPGIIWSLLVDSAGRVWAGTQQGIVYRLDPEQGNFESFDLFSGIENVNQGGFVIDLYEDSSGRIWAGTWNGGLFIYDPAADRWDRWTHDSEDPYGLPGNSISDFFEDRTGKMWVGTWNGLAHVRSLKAFDHLDLPEIENPRATSVEVDEANNLWVGTAGGVWGRRAGSDEPTVWHRGPGSQRRLSADEVSSILTDRTGRIWIGTSGGGITRFDPLTGQTTYFIHRPDDPSSLPDNLIYKIFEDRAGRIWIGTVQAGLARWNEGSDTFTGYRMQPEDDSSLASNEVWTIYQGKDGRLWAGTIGGGLHELIFDDGATGPPSVRFRHYQHDPADSTSISSNDVVALFQDDAGALWAGTMGGGLNRMDPETGAFSRFGIEQGLPHVNAGCILPDDDGRLWVSTSNGLARFDPSHGKFTAYSTADGLRTNVFYFDGCDRGPDGRLYFANTAGVTVFDPEQITDNPFPPLISLTGVYLFNQPMAMDSSAVRKRALRLPYDRNFLSFEFAALDFNLPEKNRYAYKLEGLDAFWVEAGTIRRADYPNLPPGTYTLRVRAANNDGVWSEAQALIRAVILPPVWQTLWFRVLVVLLIGGAIWSLNAYRRKKQRELQRTRQQIADDLHDDIGGNLGALSMFLARFSGSKMLSNLDRENARIYLATVQRMMSDLRDVVWLTDPGGDRLDALVDRMSAIARNMTQDLRLTFESQGIAENLTIPMNVRRHLFLIYKEALHNAVRHADATKIRVLVILENGLLRVEVHDDGSGFDPQNIQNGQGLVSMQRRAEQAEVVLILDSTPGKGTSVIFSVRI